MKPGELSPCGRLKLLSPVERGWAQVELREVVEEIGEVAVAPCLTLVESDEPE